jgi:Domain of unknown function (DUF4265)
MPERLVKITIPLPENNLAGADTESLWAEPVGGNAFKIKNVPFYAKGLSCEDVVEAEPKEGTLIFKKVIQHNGHSTYRIYASDTRKAPDVVALTDKLSRMRCEIEPATDKLVGIDVLPDADIHKVYETLQESERNGTIDFQEGHCGHLPTGTPLLP